MRGVYPEGFPDWEIAQIEKFRDSNPALYEWRKTAHLLPVHVNTYTVIERRPFDRLDAKQ